MLTMVLQQMEHKHLFIALLAGSIAVACFGWTAPQRSMPLDFYAMLWWSIPLACLWTLLFVGATFRFGRKALWLLFGAPFSFYWPVWLLLNGLPACYWHRNCV